MNRALTIAVDVIATIGIVGFFLYVILIVLAMFLSEPDIKSPKRRP